MGKRILRVYLAKNDTPYSAAYAKLELPASPWEVWDAMEKVRLQTDDILYMEVEDYYAFEYGETVIHADNAALTSYGLLHRADYEPMLSPMQQKQEKEMTMQ